MPSMNEMMKKARDYQYYAELRDKAHHEMALGLRRRERLLGVPVVIGTAVVDTAIFSTFAERYSHWLEDCYRPGIRFGSGARNPTNLLQLWYRGIETRGDCCELW